MIFAARKLQGIGIILMLTIAALIVYPVTLQVSSTRTELRRVEQEIAATRMRNRMLEGDIAVLANARQLDQWNRAYFGLVAPTAAQYLPGERALASFDRLRPAEDGRVLAPVLVAIADRTARDEDAPRGSPDRVRMTSVALNDIASAAIPMTVASVQ